MSKVLDTWVVPKKDSHIIEMTLNRLMHDAEILMGDDCFSVNEVQVRPLEGENVELLFITQDDE